LQAAPLMAMWQRVEQKASASFLKKSSKKLFLIGLMLSNRPTFPPPGLFPHGLPEGAFSATGR
jgi:hypothetical protein